MSSKAAQTPARRAKEVDLTGLGGTASFIMDALFVLAKVQPIFTLRPRPLAQSPVSFRDAGLINPALRPDRVVVSPMRVKVSLESGAGEGCCLHLLQEVWALLLALPA